MFQSFEILGARYFRCTHAGGVGVEDLNIEQDEAPLAESFHQVDERDIGGIRAAVEHGLPGEQSADRHTVDSPHKLIPHPRLHTVRISHAVQFRVGIEHRRGNPGPFLVAAGSPDEPSVVSPTASVQPSL